MQRTSVSYSKYGYIFCVPFVLAFLVFSLYPILYTAVIGFTDLRGMGKTDFLVLYPDPFENFKLILKNPSFITSLRNTALIWTLNFIPQIGLALLLTAWFTNQRLKVKGQGAFKILLYMPNIITAATIAILFNSLQLSNGSGQLSRRKAGVCERTGQFPASEMDGAGHCVVHSILDVVWQHDDSAYRRGVGDKPCDIRSRGD
jgi:ABC-type sugar transport system permease subunit